MPESYLTYNALIRTNDITNLFYQLYAKSFIHIEKKTNLYSYTYRKNPNLYSLNNLHAITI